MSIFSQNALNIGIAFTLRDNFSAPMRSIQAQMMSTDAQVRRSATNQMRSMRDLNLAGAAIGATALYGIRQWVNIGADFDYTMTSVRASAEGTRQQFLALDKSARDLGKSTMFSARDVASGMQMMAMAGFDAEQIDANIKAATALAGATGNIIGGKLGSADIMTNIMYGFGAKPEESMRYADILTTATIKSNTNLQDIAEAIKYAQSTMTTLNLGIEETSAIAMTLSNAGIQGSMLGVSIDNFGRYIARAVGESRTDRQGAALKKLGLQPEQLRDAKGNLLELSEIARVIGRQIEGMNNVDRANVLFDLFGVRGGRGAVQLVKNLQDMDKMLHLVNNESEGRAQKTLEVRMESLWASLERVTSASEDLAIAWTSGITPALKIGLGAVEGVLNGITSILSIPYLGPFVTTAITGFIAVKTVSMGYRAVVGSINMLYRTSSAMMTATGTTTVAWWQRMSNAAMRYSATAATATAASRTGNMFGIQNRFGMGALNVNSAGNFYRVRNGVPRNVSSDVGLRYMNMYGSRLSASQRGIPGILGKIGFGLGKVGPLLGRAVGFLGGPWGLALSIGIPALISAIKSNTDAQEENSDEIQSSRLKIKFDREYQNNYLDPTANRRYDVEAAISERYSKMMVTPEFEAFMRSFADKKNQATNHQTNVYIDNKEAVKRQIEEYNLNEQFNSY